MFTFLSFSIALPLLARIVDKGIYTSKTYLILSMMCVPACMICDFVYFRYKIQKNEIDIWFFILMITALCMSITSAYFSFAQA